ncbi:MAG: hypothetical protein ACE14V_08520 [bacterium]
MKKVKPITFPEEVDSESQEKASRRAKLSKITGIISLVLCCIPLFFIPLILSILELRAIKKGKAPKAGDSDAFNGLALGITSLIVFGLCVLIGSPGFFGSIRRSQISRAIGESRMVELGLEAYFADHNTYPLPDEPRTQKRGSYKNDGTYATDGGIIPKILTTPIAYITALPRDPFRLKGKGYYGFGSGPGKVNLIGTDNGKYLSEGGKPVLVTKGWIITSYGPDKVDGNSGIKSGSILREEVAWTDNIDTTQPLVTSGFTYDPTNGTNSPGDLWRRGP